MAAATAQALPIVFVVLRARLHRGLALWGLGLVVIGPLLGHASWHAYRGAVRWQEPPAAPAPATVA